MRKFKRTATLAVTPILCTGVMMAQKLKITDPKSLETGMAAGTNSVSNIAIMIVGAVLAIALITIIYKLSQGANGAKEALIGWIAAVIVYGIAITYVLNVAA